jgi:hypothetical protein
MIKKSVAMRGVLPTLAYAARWPLVIYDERRSLAERNAIQLKFDAQYGTDTGGIIPLSSFTIDNPNWVHGVRYAPTSPERFRESLALLNLDSARYRDFTFVDVGSGKGATMLYAADLGFKAVIGIEFVEELHKIAQKNISLYPAAKDIGQSICTDALTYKMPPAPLVVFFNYPFSSHELMDGVIRNISQSGPGEKYLLAVNYPYNPATLPSGKLRLISSVKTHRHNYAFEVV